MLLLDLCCGVGGASVGYHRAGFTVFGVDLNPQPDYPHTFKQMNIREITAYNLKISGAAFIHVSPPCQVHTALTKGTNQGAQYQDHLEYAREICRESGIPYVLENVQGAPLRRDMILCGETFGLQVIRHRIFEFGNMPTPPAPAHKPHRGRVAGMRHGIWYTGPYYAVYGEGGGKGTVAEWRRAMGIDWTWNRKSIAEAIPPAYTEYIGHHVMRYLKDQS